MLQNRRPVGTKGTIVRVKTNAFALDIDLTRLKHGTALKEYFHFHGKIAVMLHRVLPPSISWSDCSLIYVAASSWCV